MGRELPLFQLTLVTGAPAPAKQCHLYCSIVAVPGAPLRLLRRSSPPPLFADHFGKNLQLACMGRGLWFLKDWQSSTRPPRNITALHLPLFHSIPRYAAVLKHGAGMLDLLDPSAPKLDRASPAAEVVFFLTPVAAGG